MIYNSKIGEIDLANVRKIYPAGVVEVDGEVARMSLEWIDTNEGKVNLHGFVLVFDFTPIGEEVRDETILEFKTKEELFISMNEVSKLFQN
ncbi:MAG: hypothetical protein GXO30_03845 [Epsilonproteobacteria bacterium]|nr:hypothetical protein [Campylobacterota bacterium]